MGFEIHYSCRIEDHICCIEDCSNTLGGPTVTNMADRVIDQIRKEPGLPDGMPIIYRDSDGIWDELLVKNGRFWDFAPIQVRNIEEAKRKIRLKYSLQDIAETQKDNAEEYCSWQYDEDGFYATGCGRGFTLNEGDLQENEFQFCPYCGKKIKD
ncbi:hypothetical protein B1757_13060 [Acidithiobacillus marinus]|uniref:Uncharacterized protein n=1 Tax=Acidithiobacillus marinus TaxID=187490 RepID=A0A2I1DIW6_9PROT|nr:hypothetical protein [Acidithiobacillus marinus]PKY09811.1 hypothetical protein B1757_13060 [Acidithiobacillus marinus]